MTAPVPGPGPAAGINIDLLQGHRQLSLAAEVIERVFGEPFPVDVLVAVQLAGGYLGGAYRDGELVGCAMGFAELGVVGRRPALHSHVAAVLPQARGLRMGQALKWHQRSWALERGIETVHWTFDPLVRRNSHLNLNLLGADAVGYLQNLYGTMPDALNGNQQTDRLLVAWDLTSDRAHSAATGRPDTTRDLAGARVLLRSDDAGEPELLDDQDEPAGMFLVGTPADVEALVAHRPATAARWRDAQRRVLKPLVDKGYSIPGVTDDGFLIVFPPTPENS